MIDLLAFLTEQTDYEFDISGLENVIIESKRNGFKELKGVIKINSIRGDTLELIDKDKYDEKINISISNKSLKYDIFESYCLVIKYKSNCEKQKDKISFPLQSELTGKLVDQIIDTGKSDLTPYNDCMIYHIPMLDAFKIHFSTLTNEYLGICPIT